MLIISNRRRTATTNPATRYSTWSLTKLAKIMLESTINPKLPHSALEFALDLATHVTVRDLAPPVAPLLARGQCQLDLCPRALEVDPGRYQGQAALRGFADQPLDLRPMQKQLARPLRLMVLATSRLVRRDVEVAQPHLAIVDYGVGVGHLGLPGAQRLDLGAAQHHPGLDPLEPLKFVPGAAIGCDVARSRVTLLLALLSHPPAPDPPAPGPLQRRSPGRISGHRAAVCASTPGRPAPSRSHPAQSARCRRDDGRAENPRRRRQAHRRSR